MKRSFLFSFPSLLKLQFLFSLGSLSNNDRRQRKRLLKSRLDFPLSFTEFALLQTLSRLFQVVQFVKCW